uniref:Methyltransferase 21C, AARS1 lysine b n=1 Tax=Poecilia reticulata TaxID=8081 RepID=A0A3P9NWS4_POERE
YNAIALCQFLENNQQQMNLMDKAVLELGAGTGLLSIVTSLLGAWVTATDLPDILSNLSFNLRRNTKGRSRYIPQVAALSWGQELERDFPFPSYRYDYVLAADVVYHHDFLEELSSRVLGLASLNFLFTISHRFSMGFRSGELPGQLSTVGITWSVIPVVLSL